MKLALIITVAVAVLFMALTVVLLRAAVKYTDKHERAKLQLRKARGLIMDLQDDVYDLRRQLAAANAEIDKWKCKAVEISINAQKGIEKGTKYETQKEEPKH